MDILSQITLSEVMLLFNILFILPAMAYLLLRLRKYEQVYGDLPESKKKKVKKEAPPPVQPAVPKVNLDVFPFQARTFLTPSEKACLTALGGALGGEVLVFPKVALWETVEAKEDDAEQKTRLHNKDFDFLVCDRATCQPLTAVLFRAVQGPAVSRAEEIKKICAAAGVNLVFIEQTEEYDAATLKEELGIPEINLGQL